MSVYTSYIPTDSSNCVVCMEEITDKSTDVVAHSNLHPIHKSCIRSWVQVHNSCPICRAEINVISVVSSKERKIIECKHILEDSRDGAIVSLMAGMIGVVAGVSICGRIGHAFGWEGLPATDFVMPLGWAIGSGVGITAQLALIWNDMRRRGVPLELSQISTRRGLVCGVACLVTALTIPLSITTMEGSAPLLAITTIAGSAMAQAVFGVCRRQGLFEL